MRYNAIEIIKVLKNKNYKIFSNPFSINLVGVRSKKLKVNYFNDVLAVFYNDKNNDVDYSEYQITTVPGFYYLEHPMNVKGCALLKEGQYPGMWEIGKHFNQTALVQKNNCTVIRDDDKDDVLDFDTGVEETGVFAINCHRKNTPGLSLTVDMGSAGCQVHADYGRFEDEFMPLMVKASAITGNSFTYTLINEKDLS